MICDSKWSVNVYFPLTPTIYDLKYSLSKQNKNCPRRAEVEMLLRLCKARTYLKTVHLLDCHHLLSYYKFSNLK